MVAYPEEYWARYEEDPTYERLPGLTVFFHREHYPDDSEDYEVAAA